MQVLITLISPASLFASGENDCVPFLTLMVGVLSIPQFHGQNNFAMGYLKAGKDWIDHDLVFCQNDGTPLDADNLYHRDFNRILIKAGLRHIRIHDLRHTFASILIATRHNPKNMQSQMGHASINITMDLYGHLPDAGSP